MLEIVPKDARNNSRYVMMKTMLKEAPKDLALIPDRVIIPMVEQMREALTFVLEGDLEELEEYLASQRDNPEEG